MTADDRNDGPMVLGISGEMRFGTANEQALRIALQHAEGRGARTQLIPGSRLVLPNFDDEVDPQAPAQWLLDAVEQAEGIVLCSPSYHGGVTGLLKNGLDYLELLRERPRPYLRDLPVGCIATGDGWQGPVSTLGSMRQMVHALQGWPTPLGVAHNVADGGLGDVRDQIITMTDQIIDFIAARRALAGR